jgi:hypothetical protein
LTSALAGKSATRVLFFWIDCVETPPGASRAAPNPSNEAKRAINQSWPPP